MHVNYIPLLKRFYPNELQTACKGLAKYRYRKMVMKAFRGQTTIEKYVGRITEGKFFVYYECRLGVINK